MCKEKESTQLHISQLKFNLYAKHKNIKFPKVAWEKIEVILDFIYKS